MIVGIKDSAKLIGISIIAFCAVFVCTMFMNYEMDIIGIKEQIAAGPMMTFYDAQIATAKIISAVSGFCLFITSVIMLLFYIKHYIDIHNKELGILKALGYSNLKIAKNFWTFGISVFLGTALGYIGAFLLMPSFYKIQNEDKILPDVVIRFHPSLLVCLVIVPTVVFSILAICYAWYKLRVPALKLIGEDTQNYSKTKNHKDYYKDNGSFLDDLKRNILHSRKVLVFFIIFASFCFSSMTQMAFGMRELASLMMGVIILLIGLVLACTTMILAVTTVVNGNIKTIAMMKAFGYSLKECSKAILGGYRPMAYIGFAIGTAYQYALLRIMVDIVFRNISGVPSYEFNYSAMLISLAAFIVIYEIMMYAYTEKIRKISIKKIMLEY